MWREIGTYLGWLLSGAVFVFASIANATTKTTNTSGIPLPQRAVSTAVQAAPTLPWSDSTKYHVCDQACLLQKANENISLQALYIVRRISNERNLYSVGVYDKQSQNFAQVVSDLHLYCEDVQGDSRTDAKTCLERYIRIQSTLLRSMRAAILKNSTSASLYYSKVPVAASGARESKLPQTPWAPSQKELTQQMAAANRELTLLGSDQYASWEASLPHKPDPTDFCKVVTKPDPNNPKSGTIAVQEMGPDGTCVYDKSAYQAAMNDYKDLISRIQSANKSSTASKAMMKSYLPVATASPDPAEGVAYHQAKNQFVHASNDLMLKTGVAVMSFGGAQSANRSMASVGSNSPEVDTSPLPVKETRGDSVYTLTFSPEEMDKVLKNYQMKNLDQYLDEPPYSK